MPGARASVAPESRLSSRARTVCLSIIARDSSRRNIIFRTAYVLECFAPAFFFLSTPLPPVFVRMTLVQCTTTLIVSEFKYWFSNRLTLRGGHRSDIIDAGAFWRAVATDGRSFSHSNDAYYDMFPIIFKWYWWLYGARRRSYFSKIFLSMLMNNVDDDCRNFQVFSEPFLFLKSRLNNQNLLHKYGAKPIRSSHFTGNGKM